MEDNNTQGEDIQKPCIEDAQRVTYIGTLGHIRLWDIVLVNGKAYLRIENIDSKEVENIAYVDRPIECKKNQDEKKQEVLKIENINGELEY